MTSLWVFSLLTMISLTNCIELVRENVLEKGWIIKWSIPACSNNYIFSSKVLINCKLWSSGKRTIRGWGEKVNKTVSPFWFLAISLSLSMMILWPKWTPAKVPVVKIGRFTFWKSEMEWYTFKFYLMFWMLKPCSKVLINLLNKSLPQTKYFT